MKKQNIFTAITIVSLVIALCATISIMQKASAEHISANIHEDQFVICDFKESCIVINADDVLTDEQIEKLWMQFKYELDTFPYGVQTK